MHPCPSRVITEQVQMLKKEASRAGLSHRSDAGKISGTYERTRRWARRKDKLSRLCWHLGAITPFSWLTAELCLAHQDRARAARRCAWAANVQLATPELSVTRHQLI